jgi:uncharacterized protein (DUF488 family)
VITIYTIGHSTRLWPDFVSLLNRNRIFLIADVRRYPHSQKFPQFNREELEANLVAEGIGYMWIEALGGWRHSGLGSDSPNKGLMSVGLRNYADHMLTEEFQGAVQQLLEAAAQRSTSILCAERLYWKCHRRLLCDYLVSQSVKVVHIEDESKVSPHRLTPGAVLAPDGVTYPEVQP